MYCKLRKIRPEETRFHFSVGREFGIYYLYVHAVPLHFTLLHGSE